MHIGTLLITDVIICKYIVQKFFEVKDEVFCNLFFTDKMSIIFHYNYSFIPHCSI